MGCTKTGKVPGLEWGKDLAWSPGTMGTLDGHKKRARQSLQRLSLDIGRMKPAGIAAQLQPAIPHG